MAADVDWQIEEAATIERAARDAAALYFRPDDDKGFLDRMRGRREAPDLTTLSEPQVIEEICDNLVTMERAFNSKARKLRLWEKTGQADSDEAVRERVRRSDKIDTLGLRMNVRPMVNAVRSRNSRRSLRRFKNLVRLWKDPDAGGKVYETTIQTLVDVIAQLLAHPGQSGQILGALQSGKTITSIAMQWVGPALYLLTGKKYYPMYLLTRYKSHQSQTEIELRSFLEFYGTVELCLDNVHRCTLNEYRAAMGNLNEDFVDLPTLETYRDAILHGADSEIHHADRFGDYSFRRVPGQQKEQIRKKCRTAFENGFLPLFMIDESQFGSTDHATGQHCVIRRIFEDIKEATEGSQVHFICVSATPFETYHTDLWVVKQALGPNYVGFNVFNGELIDEASPIDAPDVYSLTNVAEQTGIEFLTWLSMTPFKLARSVLDRKHNPLSDPIRRQRFHRWASKHVRRGTYSGSYIAWATAHGYPTDPDGFADSLIAALRGLLVNILEDGGDCDAAGKPKPFGICVRLVNDNTITREIIEQLALDPERVEIISIFDTQVNRTSGSIKEVLRRERKRPDLPFIIFVTNLARMGDSFPIFVRFFIDLVAKSVNLNSLLQGLLGRACGYFKESTVILSDDNVKIVDNWLESEGEYGYLTSRGSDRLDARRAGAPAVMLRIMREWGAEEPRIARLFEEVERCVLDEWFPNRHDACTLAETKRKDRFGPLLDIFERLDLFDFFESRETRKRFFPHFLWNVRLARRDTVLPPRKADGEPIRFKLDERGWCQFTFRWTSHPNVTGGWTEKDEDDSGKTNRARKGSRFDPMVRVAKFYFDGRPMEMLPLKKVRGSDRRRRPKDTRRGRFECIGLIMPLAEPVRIGGSADITVPTERNVFDPYLTGAKREKRDKRDHKG